MMRPNGRCRECNEGVLVVLTAAGYRQILNPLPDPAGNTAAYRDGAGAWRSRAITADRPADPWERVYMPHQATCKTLAARRAARQLELPVPVPDNVIRLADRRRTRPTTPRT